MDELEKARGEVDRIDRAMARLFRRRMDAAGRIAAYKKEKGLPVLDSARERAVMDRNMRPLAGSELAGYYASFLANVLFLSRRYQARLAGRRALACREDEAAFAAPVAAGLFAGAELLPTATHRDVFEAVEAGDAELGLVAYAEGWAGGMDAVLDLCGEHACCVCAVAELQGPPQEAPLRCLVLAAQPAPRGDCALLMVQAGGHVGRLAEVVEALAAGGYEIEQVKSRPVPGGAGGTTYFISLKNPGGALGADELAEEMARLCPGCRLLGVYELTAVAAG